MEYVPDAARLPGYYKFISAQKIRAGMIRNILHYQRRLTGDSLFETLKRYVIFVSGGFIGWVILISLHELLQKQTGFQPVVSYGAGIIAADVFTFIYHRRVTFKIKTKWKIRFMKFSFLLIGLSAANWALFSLGRGILNIPVPDAVISFLITAFLSVVNFTLNKTVIFRHK